MLIRSVLVLLPVLFLATVSVADEVYKTVDENGNVVFTDSPPKDKPAEKIKLKETNIQPPVEFRSRGREGGEAAQQKDDGPYNPRIVSPGNEYQMGPTETSLNVTVDTSRPLEDEHFFRLFVNGAPHGDATQSNLTLTDVRRGRKQLVVSIVDAEGSVIATSPPVTVYVIRPNPKPM